MSNVAFGAPAAVPQPSRNVRARGAPAALPGAQPACCIPVRAARARAERKLRQPCAGATSIR